MNQRQFNNPVRSAGFSLIEMMLAMLIGLIIMGGVMQLYMSTRDTQRSSEDQLNMLADARFAIEAISYDLRHAGIWGRHNVPSYIACQKTGSQSIACPAGNAMPAATSDCAAEDYIYLERPVFASDNSNPYAATCASEGYKAGTDVLNVRYADTNKIGSTVLSSDVAYIRSSLQSGMLFMGPDIPDANFYKWGDDNANSNHLLISRVYYVSDYTDSPGDGLPSLRRGDLVSGPAMESSVLLPGVEDFQLEFGVDIGTNGVAGTDKDGQVDSYVKASSVTADGWTYGEVLAVRIWVLLRSQREDRNDIGSAQTFNIAGTTVTTANDGYRRYLVSSVVKLRNTRQLDTQSAGGA